MNKGTSKWDKALESRGMENRCWEFLKPLLGELHRKVDRGFAGSPWTSMALDHHLRFT